jgi:hypothetical protein
MPNSWHKAVSDFSRRVAATTNFTLCSSTSIVIHGILGSPERDQFARELKHVPGRFVKHVMRLDTKYAKRMGHPRCGKDHCTKT